MLGSEGHIVQKKTPKSNIIAQLGYYRPFVFGGVDE